MCLELLGAILRIRDMRRRIDSLYVVEVEELRYSEREGKLERPHARRIAFGIYVGC